MTPVFADTSFFIALLNPRDQFHSKAVSAMTGLESPMMTSDWVLAELGGSLSRAFDRSLYVDFLDELRAERAVVIIPADRKSFDDGLALFRERADKNWSMVDCISFVIMRDHGLREALTTDHHFNQAGFIALMT